MVLFRMPWLFVGVGRLRRPSGVSPGGFTMNKSNPTILDAIRRLRVDDEQVIELRALNVPRGYGRPVTCAGWFDDMDALAEHAARLDARGAPGVYVTLNPCNQALLARACNRVIDAPSATTTDRDIIRRAWLPIDFDPVRPAGISSSLSEVEAARMRAREVVEWLNRELDAKPEIWAFSGNGFHALYRIDLPNDDESTAFVRNIITAASDQFSDDAVSIDKTVFNAGRIWKLYGTLTRKGENLERLGRVHRRACILGEGFND